ncbi:hypothetical protein GCM10011497_04330 [Elstera cyanobacteriorum]|nr:GGDEF domain-containing protein [Elstera cyanobacteriorum]GFZ79321.1 hypothetical protein GCM10011497_04330 [Elstera cyanobacteriorum]
MSLRLKLIMAFLLTSLITVAVMGGVAYERLERRFGEIVEAGSARNFRGDVAAYWLTYGSWEAGIKLEPFTQFVGRRRAFLAARGAETDTGDADQAQPLPPMRPGEFGSRPARPPYPIGTGSEGGNFRPLFRFTLYDPEGIVLNPRQLDEFGMRRQVTADERAQGVPIRVKGEIVAYALPQGTANYSTTDLAYLAAMQNALIWGSGAAALMAILLGLLAGRHVNRTLSPFTQAIAGMHGGVLRQQVPVRSRDEIGLLAEAFNRMSDELARSHEALRDKNREINAHAEKLYEVSIRDGLTGLFNRRHFDEIAAGLVRDAEARGAPLVLALADIDFFKRINDACSHATGDAVLRQIALLLTQTLRAGDTVGRYGGEEFVLALPNTDFDSAIILCEQVRQAVAAYPWAEIDPRLSVTLCVGIAAHAPGQTAEETLKAADRHLYRAKAEGRNRVCG